ncbi:MAG: SMC family ATPase [Nocardioides sp.]
MRLHHLEATAFGPFAETVRVDFDDLSEAGLFLLSGPTGAGKTSVLDAVCFALYGDVPGDRSSAKRLRSDQAAPGIAPRVTLEVTLGGRRFRLVRSPMWQRPKARGAGTTPQQATVTISERLDGVWTPLSSRLDETGHLVTALVGMNITQFTQVAMLPQGKFQAFLRARSEDRHKLLQQLFRTGRFEQIEGWLRDRRLALRREAGTAHQVVADLVSRVSETAEAPLPDDWDAGDLSLPVLDGAVARWAQGWRSVAVESLEAATGSALTAVAGEARRRAALESGRALHQRRRRHEAAAAEHRELSAAADSHAARNAVVAAARRAAAVTPLEAVAASSADRQHAAVLAVEVATGHEALVGVPRDRPALLRVVAQHATAAARVRALAPRAERLTSVRAEIDRLGAQRDLLGRRRTTLARRRAEAPAAVDRLRHEVATAQAAEAAVEGVRQRHLDLRARLDATALTAELELSLASARAVWVESRAAALLRREEWLGIREARLDGMAAEIAGALAVGACCPVCGSADHPAKASSAPGTPDAAVEKAALRAVDDANSAELLRDRDVRDLETGLALTRDRAGDQPADELRAGLAAAGAELAVTESAAARVDALSHELADAVRRLEADAADAEVLAAESARAAAAATALDKEAAALLDEIRSVLDHDDVDALPAVLEQHLATERAAHCAADALSALEAAARSLAEAEGVVTEAACAAGFGSPQAAAAAALPAAEIDRLDQLVATHERRLAAVAEVLAEGESDVSRHDREAVVDLDGLERAHAASLAALGDAQALVGTWTTRRRRLAGLVDELSTAEAAWRPVHDELELATRLSSFVEGKSPDNRWQMRLSAYVLAFRLSQVVAAANERLARMSDQRYSLEHTGRRGAGETRGGLSLLVRDDWSGEARDPATLSGGETFVVSLALALGLADVIGHESDAGAAGSRLDTLFVDEGFGSLDAETLDDVMDTLDSLRDGGRVVCVVSHVAEMRDRIPTQLLVTKSRRGSTVSVRR